MSSARQHRRLTNVTIEACSCSIVVLEGILSHLLGSTRS
jgi:hypothetical protein